jgi:hypothetical protein
MWLSDDPYARSPLSALYSARLHAAPPTGPPLTNPSDPPVPPGASVVAKAKAADDDDPMRGREVVIDTATAGPTETVAYYREQFSATEGWLDGTPDPDGGGGGHLLCLVSHAHDDFDEYVEIYPYGNGSKPAGPHRYLVSISRLHVPEADKRNVERCGLASAWFPTDL